MEELAIVILNYKNYLMTIECIKKLIEINTKSRIIVVDNNSPNESYQVLVDMFKEYRNIEIIKNNENLGYAKGNNIGIIKAVNDGANYIAIMNPDIILECSCTLESLIKKINESNLGGITALPITNNEYIFNSVGWKAPNFKELICLNLILLKRIFNPIQYEKIEIINKKSAVAEIDVMPGCFFVLTTECFKEINYFDEKTFLYYEENILAAKAKEKGYRFAISLNDFYIHNHLGKDLELNDYKYKAKDRKIVLESQRYYAEKYLKLSSGKMFLLNCSQFINRYIELPLLHILKRIIKYGEKK